ncbi:integral membrane protein [Moniliophthora roreri]|nr:integral membrane protein [Moniliophthora roreri]
MGGLELNRVKNDSRGGTRFMTGRLLHGPLLLFGWFQRIGHSVPPPSPDRSIRASPLPVLKLRKKKITGLRNAASVKNARSNNFELTETPVRAKFHSPVPTSSRNGGEEARHIIGDDEDDWGSLIIICEGEAKKI